MLKVPRAHRSRRVRRLDGRERRGVRDQTRRLDERARRGVSGGRGSAVGVSLGVGQVVGRLVVFVLVVETRGGGGRGSGAWRGSLVGGLPLDFGFFGSVGGSFRDGAAFAVDGSYGR
jgi:hypothetical protein